MQSTITPDTFSHLNVSIGYAMLVIDDLKLLIPQEQIKSLEMTGDMKVGEAGDLAAGFFQFENRSWPIYCFNNNLTLLNPAPLNYKVCILLQTDNDYFGILCEQALLLNEQLVHPLALPESMLTADSPISALAVYGDEVTSISSAELLFKLLPLNVASETEELTFAF